MQLEKEYENLMADLAKNLQAEKEYADQMADVAGKKETKTTKRRRTSSKN